MQNVVKTCDVCFTKVFCRCGLFPSRSDLNFEFKASLFLSSTKESVSLKVQASLPVVVALHRNFVKRSNINNALLQKTIAQKFKLSTMKKLQFHNYF